MCVGGGLPSSILLRCDVFGDASKKLHTTLAMGMTRGGGGGSTLLNPAAV